MSNEEKLRALLAEARKIVHTILDIDALHGWACESDDDEPALDDTLRYLRSSIDAALAEPVENWKQAAEIQEQFKLAAMKERDEALAEVERLKADLAFAERFRIPAQQLAADTAYERGAEAMREAAARACADVAPTYGVPDWMSHACASAVIALPLPEEKP